MSYLELYNNKMEYGARNKIVETEDLIYTTVAHTPSELEKKEQEEWAKVTRELDPPPFGSLMND